MSRLSPVILLGLYTSLLSSPALAQSLVSGPMVGDTGPTESRIWLQTDAPASFRVKYWPAGSPETEALLSDPAATSDSRFLTGQVLIKGLRPDTRYQYRILLGDTLIERPYALSFKTAPVGVLPEIDILLGSCYYLDDPLMKLFNLSYGTGMEIFTSMARLGGDMMFWLGDNIYFAPFDLSNRYNMNQRYLKQRSAPELQPLLASMPQYAIWDDHDFGPNNSNRTFWGKRDALDLFEAYWSNPRQGLVTTPGTFFVKSWGDVDFIATDDRYHRAPNDDPDPGRDYFGPAQLAWLEQQLRASKATFKLVVVGSPVLNRYYEESLTQAKAEFAELTGFIAREKIQGVVFLSGDRHHTLLMKMDREGDYPLYELTNSPLTSNPTLALSDAEAADPWVLPETVVLERNFGRLRVHGKAGERVLTIETRDKQGELIWEYDIPESELKAPQSVASPAPSP